MNKANINVKVLNESYYEKVLNFILKNYAQLENKDFFIIDDIHTSLPTVFGNDGIIIGALNEDDEIIAIQAVDYSDDVQHGFIGVLPNSVYTARYAEMGWTMTDARYRNKGIAKLLIGHLEELIVRQSKQFLLVSTIHPDNVKSLKVYLHLGYVGTTLQTHFGLPRIYLIKDINNISAISVENEIKVASWDDLIKAFDCGYVLTDIVCEEEKTYYILIK